MDIYQESLAKHLEHQGKITTQLKFPLKDKHDLSWTYTPGVAEVSRYLALHPEETGQYTFKGNSVAVISDGSAVLGLGNIGPYGAYPVMEGKALLFKHFANIDSIPIVLNTQDPDEIIKAVEMIAPSFGGINLEDIAAPKCFYIEETLKKRLDIPVVHDDQWGTAVVVLAGLFNALKVVNKQKEKVKIVISGAGAAGTAIMRILLKAGFVNFMMVDSKGIIAKS
ncbi:MAG: malic enzyme-like NAD(P)-binding protein [bacterium]